MITVDVQDGATERLRGLLARVTRRQPLMAVLGREAETMLREHFASRPPNKKGWQSKGFWGDVAQATAFERATEDLAEVKVASRPFLQRLYGGTITADAGRALAIPLTARAYAAGRPALWGGSGSLVLIKTARAAILREALQPVMGSGGKRKRGSGIQGGEAQYLLVKRVTQRPDRRALPSETALRARLRRRAGLYLERVITSAGGTI